MPKCTSAMLLFLILLTSGSPALAAPKTSPLLTTILTNYGGRANITSIRNITATGRIYDFRKGKEGPYRYYLATERRLRTESLVTASSSGDVRILSGAKGWKNNGQSMIPLQGNELTSWQANYEALAFPLTFLAENLTIAYDAPSFILSHPVDSYVVKLPNAPPMTMHLDPTSMLVHRIEWLAMNEARLAVEFGDYRFVDGVLFPFRIVTYADAIKTAEISIASIALNEQLAPGVFRP